jgi:hypothetical protein
MNKQPNVDTVRKAIERWLRLQLSGTPDGDEATFLYAIGAEAPSRRLQALHHVLQRSPDLAAKAAQVGLPEQLRLSLELVGQPLESKRRPVAPTANFGRCRAIRHGPQRRPAGR